MHPYVLKGLLVAIAVLGGLGTYLMLPKLAWHWRGASSGNGRGASLRRGLDRWDAVIHHGRARWLGAALASLALVGILILFRPADAFVSSTVFYILAIVAIVSGVMMITSRAPVYSALWFALVVLSTAGLFLLQGGQFLAAATVIIYAGAIIVTFLFVVMLAQQETLDRTDRGSREPLLTSFCGFVLLWCLLYATVYTFRSPPPGPNQGNRAVPPAAFTVLWSYTADGRPVERPLPPQHRSYRAAVPWSAEMPLPNEEPHTDTVAALGATIFRDHLVSLEVAGTLLLIALIGAIAIASSREPRRPAAVTGRPQPEYGPKTPDFNLGERRPR